MSAYTIANVEPETIHILKGAESVKQLPDGAKFLFAMPWYEDEAFHEQGWWSVWDGVKNVFGTEMVAAFDRRPTEAMLLALAAEHLG